MNKSSTKEKWENNYHGNICIYSDLTMDDIEPLRNEEKIEMIQFFMYKTPSVETWKVLNAFFEKYPEIALGIKWEEEIDFSFLPYIPAVKKLFINSYQTKDFSPLAQYLDLESLYIGDTKSQAVQLDFIEKFTRLKTFYNDGMKKGIETISELKHLETLWLRAVKKDDLHFIENLDPLQDLSLQYGSYKNVDALSKMPQLKKLDISRVRQIPHYDFLQKLNELERLIFEGMSQMESLPDFSGLQNLQSLILDNNSKLIDISSMNQLPRLENFRLSFSENFKASDRKRVLQQAYEIVLNSHTIKHTNILRYLDEDQSKELRQKGVEEWY